MIRSAILVVMVVTCGYVCLPDVASGKEREVEKATVADSRVGQHDLAGVPGRVLIQKLLDADSRSLAFYELWRRNERNKDHGYESFLEDHYDPEVVVCPQGNAAPPVYLVLYGFLGRETFSIHEGYEIPNPFELFPPVNGQSHERKWEVRAIEAFTAEGKCIEPFGGDNCLQESGVITDMNGDGLVERADHTSYSVDGISDVDVLHISVVKPEPQPLLSVLYNWGEDEWSYRFTDPDKDGILRVELGPKIPGGIKPKLVYKWDENKMAYSGPVGKKGDHYRLLDVAETDLFEVFERLKKSKLTFPKDPDFVDEHTGMDDPWAKRGQKKPSPKDLSKPYRYASLKALSNEDIVRYMGEGKCIFELEWANVIKTHIPTNFWTLDPKSAAFATADENRYPDHQKRFRLAVDDRDGRKPPDTCSISFTDVSDKSYNDVDSHYFLRVDPKRSYLAYARSWAGGAVFYNVVHDQPAFDFRLCEMTYEEARHVAHTVWWLNRVRSHGTDSSEGIDWTSADGRGSLVLRQEGGDVLVKIDETMWAGHVSERWRTDFTPEVCLNLTSFLIADALTDRLGTQWSRFEPKHSQDILARQTSAPQYEQDEVKRIRTLTETFLDLFSTNQTSISFAIVREAARAAGGFAYTNLAAKLADIQTRLPTASEPDLQALRDSISLSMKKIQCADDLHALQEWASSKERGCQWALQRLKEKDRKRYVATLEWWMKNTKEKWARQAFDAIAAEDSERAAEIAKGIPPGQKGDLAVSAFAHLAEVNGIPDEQKRVKALIDVALDPKSGWEERGRAIELLVPPEQPLRYPTPDVDAALVRLLSPEMADDVVNFTLGRACRSLARRGRTEYFDKMAKVLKNMKDILMYVEVLGSLTQLAQCDPAKYNPRLQALLKPQLKQTNKSVTDILLAVWSADLRDLAPALENIATATPDDYEDERARSYGGEVRAIEGRFHLARKILSLWNEEDAMTRCRLLLAFGFNHAYQFAEELAPERLARMKVELAKTAQTLTRDERKEATAFLQWYQDEHINKENEPVYRDRLVKFAALAQAVLNLQ